MNALFFDYFRQLLKVWMRTGLAMLNYDAPMLWSRQFCDRRTGENWKQMKPFGMHYWHTVIMNMEISAWRDVQQMPDWNTVDIPFLLSLRYKVLCRDYTKRERSGYNEWGEDDGVSENIYTYIRLYHIHSIHLDILKSPQALHNRLVIVKKNQVSGYFSNTKYLYWISFLGWLLVFWQTFKILDNIDSMTKLTKASIGTSTAVWCVHDGPKIFDSSTLNL